MKRRNSQRHGGETLKEPNINSISTKWNSDKSALTDKVSDTVDLTNLTKNFILMHGYSVDLNSGREFMNETYKRLYHSGSNALFTGIHWVGNDSSWVSTVLQSYWRNNKGAFNTADDLSALVGKIGIGGKTTIAAHSMGNVVMGAAISDFDLVVDNYFMLDPAVPLEAYDSNQLQEEKMMHPDWEKFYFGTELPANFKSAEGRKLWSAEWYSLFPECNDQSQECDERRKLTWRGRFSKLIESSVNVVQYYSKGEEVLEPAKKGLSFINSPLGRGAWNLSEKAKGNRNIGTLFSGDSRAGWDFRKLNSFSSDCILHPFTPCNTGEFTSPEEARAIAQDMAQLRITPFFRKFIETGIFDTTAGSEKAKQQHPHVLSYDMPALSFAAGGTRIGDPQVLVGKKFDMNETFITNGWPSEGGHNKPNSADPAWFHSDFKDVAYLYTSELFKHMVAIGDLK